MTLPPAYLRNGELAGMRYTLTALDKILLGTLGSRTGSATGSSLDFSDYREYHPGDDLRRLDWNIYARSDRLTVKLFHEEVSPHVDIIIDASASMSIDPGAKANAAAWLSALLWTAARNAECTATAWSISDSIRPLGESTRRPSNWEPLTFESGSDPLRTLSSAGNVWRHNGIRFIISDLLWQGEPPRAVRQLAAGAAQIIVVQLLATDDINPPPTGRWRLTDSENESSLDLFVDAGVQAKYRNALQSLQRQWRDGCRRHGAIFTTITAEELLSSQRPVTLEQAGIISLG